MHRPFRHTRALMLAGAMLAAAAPLSAQAQPAKASDTVGRQWLNPAVRPTAYAIEVTPDATALTFAGKVAITIDVQAATRTITLNTADLKLSDVDLAGMGKPVATRSDTTAQTTSFTFARPVAVGSHVLTIAYTGKINDQASGLFYADYKSGTETKRVLATQFEAPDARRFVPSFDQPDMKATWQLTAIVPKGLTVLNNMPAERTEDAGGGKDRVTFGRTPAMSSYLLYFGMGELDRIRTMVGDTEVAVVARKGEAEKGRIALGDSAQLLAYYNDYFGAPYPLPKLDNFGMPNGGGFGAMENWGAILYFDRYILLDPKLSTPSDRQNTFNIVAHEMAHQWFGDLVTMKWWDNLWLNESFASWMAAKATHDAHPDWNAWLQEEGGKESAMELDATNATHPVVQRIDTLAQASQSFDVITYQKGQAVLRMVEDYAGADKFREGVRTYMKAHAYGNAIDSDLWSAIATATGKDIAGIARDFTKQGGVPLITVESATCTGGNTLVRMRQGRFALDAASKAPMRWNVPLTLGTVGGEAARLSTGGSKSFAITVKGCGPVKVNAGQVGYYRTAYADAPLAALTAATPRLPAADQLGLLNDQWALAGSGDAKLAGYLAIAAAIPADADPLVAAQKVNAIADMDDLWAEDDMSPQHLAFRAWATAQLRPIYDRVGWTPAKDEGANVNLLRTSVLAQMVYMRDPVATAEVKRRFAAAQADWSTLEAATRARVIRGSLLTGDAAVWNFIRDKARSSTDPIEANELYQDLVVARDPALMRQTLALALSDEVSATIRRRFISGIATHHPELAWDFATANQAKVNALLDPLEQASFVPGLLRTSRDPGAPAKLDAWVRANVPATERADAMKVLAALRAKQAVASRLRPQLDTWIAANR